MVISDSILIFSKHAKYENFLYLVASTSRIVNEFFKNGIPLRGAISVGELSKINTNESINPNINVSSIIGLPIVESFDDEKKFNWSGVVLTDSLVNHIDNIQQDWRDVLRDMIIEYEVPIYMKKPQTKLVLNWSDRKYSKKEVEEIFRKHNKSIEYRKNKNKMNNTYSFLHLSKNIPEYTFGNDK